MEAEKKNAEEPHSALLPCGEKVYFLFIFYKYKPRVIYNNKKEEITKESETTLLKIPINNELYTEMYKIYIIVVIFSCGRYMAVIIFKGVTPSRYAEWRQ